MGGCDEGEEDESLSETVLGSSLKSAVGGSAEPSSTAPFAAKEEEDEAT